MSKMGEEYNRRLERYAPDLLEALGVIKGLIEHAETDSAVPTAFIYNVAQYAIAKIERI